MPSPDRRLPAGSQIETARMGRWWASVPRDQWPDGDEFEHFVLRHWHPEWGDRRQELVFIGIGMDEARIRAGLDACLLDADSFEPEAWHHLPDPFAPWGAPVLETA